MEELNNIISIIKKCDLCEGEATCLCFKCLNYYCEKCYKIVHDLTKNNTHKKDPLDPYVPYDLKCPAHPKIPINLYCVEEKGN